MSNPTEIHHNGPITYEEWEAGDGIMLDRLGTWEAQARSLKSEDDFEQAMAAFHAHKDDGIAGRLLLRAVEISADGTRTLVETTNAVSYAVSDNGRPQPLTVEDAANFTNGFFDYLDEKYPDRKTEVEIMVGYTLQRMARKNCRKKLEESIGSEAVEQMIQSISNTTTSDEGDWVRGLGAISGSARILAKEGAVLSFEFTPALEKKHVCVLNVHEIVPSQDGVPVQVPESMKDRGLNRDQHKALVRSERQHNEMLEKVSSVVGRLSTELRQRALPGWEEDVEFIKSRLRDLEKLKGMRALMHGRRMIEEMEPVLADIHEQNTKAQSFQTPQSREDRLFGRRQGWKPRANSR